MFKPSSSSGAEVVFLTEYRMPKAVNKRRLASFRTRVAKTVARDTHRIGGSIVSGPTRATMGGLPGYGFLIKVAGEGGREITGRILLAWKDQKQYFLNCQYLSKGTLGGEIERGCRLVVRSFRLS